MGSLERKQIHSTSCPFMAIVVVGHWPVSSAMFVPPVAWLMEAMKCPWGRSCGCLRCVMPYRWWLRRLALHRDSVWPRRWHQPQSTLRWPPLCVCLLSNGEPWLWLWSVVALESACCRSCCLMLLLAERCNLSFQQLNAVLDGLH